MNITRGLSQDGNSTNSVATWNPDETIERLCWVDDATSYTLEYFYTDQGPLEKEGLVAIAESMITEPVAKCRYLPHRQRQPLST